MYIKYAKTRTNEKRNRKPFTKVEAYEGEPLSPPVCC